MKQVSGLTTFKYKATHIQVTTGVTTTV